MLLHELISLWLDNNNLSDLFFITKRIPRRGRIYDDLSFTAGGTVNLAVSGVIDPTSLTFGTNDPQTLAIGTVCPVVQSNIILPSSNAPVPSYSFTSDNNTGMFWADNTSYTNLVTLGVVCRCHYQVLFWIDDQKIISAFNRQTFQAADPIFFPTLSRSLINHRIS